MQICNITLFSEMLLTNSATHITYQPSLWLDKWSVESVHLMVETAGITQVMSRAVSPPQRCRDGAAVYALPSFPKIFLCICIKIENNHLLGKFNESLSVSKVTTYMSFVLIPMSSGSSRGVKIFYLFLIFVGHGVGHVYQ